MAYLQKIFTVLMAVMAYVLKVDRINYALNFPVFLRNLLNLKEQHPHLYHEMKENFSFMERKTENKFSSMPIEQATERGLCWLKHSGGTIGNFDDPQTVQHHQVAFPEMIRICQDFEGEIGRI